LRYHCSEFTALANPYTPVEANPILNASIFSSIRPSSSAATCIVGPGCWVNAKEYNSSLKRLSNLTGSAAFFADKASYKIPKSERMILVISINFPFITNEWEETSQSLVSFW